MSGDFETGLSILVADEDRPSLERLGETLRSLGHAVTSYAVSTREACELIEREDPDVSIVMLHRDDEHALDLIVTCIERSSGPVIAKLDEEDPGFVARAAERGISAYVSSAQPAVLQGAIEVSVRRHAERDQLRDKVGQLETALERRTVIERAKGILMERHDLDDRGAFEMLREHARSHRARVVDVAQAVAEGTALAPGD